MTSIPKPHTTNTLKSNDSINLKFNRWKEYEEIHTTKITKIKIKIHFDAKCAWFASVWNVFRLLSNDEVFLYFVQFKFYAWDDGTVVCVSLSFEKKYVSLFKVNIAYLFVKHHASTNQDRIFYAKIIFKTRIPENE